MSKFDSAMVEYRYFDRNAHPVDTLDECAIMIGRTDDDYFGHKWHAIQVKGHFNMGSADTAEDALRVASLQAISDEGDAAVLEFKDEGLTHNDRRKSWGVFVDGERVGVFRPVHYARGYELLDLEGHTVSIRLGWNNHRATADIKAKFDNVVRHWLELIPTEADIVQRKADRLAEEERERREQEEAKRLKRIRDAAPDLLEALDKLLHWKSYTLTYEDAKAIARAAIEKATGQ